MTRIRLDLRIDNANAESILTDGCAANILNFLCEDLYIEEMRDDAEQIVK